MAGDDPLPQEHEMTLSPEQQLELIRAHTIDLIPEEELSERSCAPAGRCA